MTDSSKYKTKKIFISENKIVNVQIVPLNKIDDVRKRYKATFDDFLSSQIRFYNVYNLNNGNVLLVGRSEAPVVNLIFHKSHYLEYYTKSDLLYLKPEEEGKPKFIPTKIDMYGENFPNYLQPLILELSKILSIDSKDLDLSLKSLEKIENALKEYVPSDFLVEAIFPSLIAYCGEILRNQIKGEWFITKQGTTPIAVLDNGEYKIVRIEPYHYRANIKDNENGFVFDLDKYVYEAINTLDDEFNNGNSLKNVVENIVASRKFMKNYPPEPFDLAYPKN